LRTKLVLFISLIIVVVCSSLSWYFVRQQTDQMAGALRDTGTILAKNLAYNSRYSLIAEDVATLQRLIDGAMEVDEVVYVVMTRQDGIPLVTRTKGVLIGNTTADRSRGSALYPDSSLVKSLVQSALRDPVITPFTASDGESIYDVAVIVQRQLQPDSSLGPLALESLETASAGSPSPKVYGVVQVGLTNTPMQQALHTLVWKVMLITTLIIFVGILATVLLANRIVMPLQSLAMVARRVAEGDLTASVIPTTQDEVGELTQVFNNMTKSLQERDRAISANIETITKQVKHLSALNETGMAITSILDVERLLTIVLDLLAENLGFSRMMLVLYDRERGVAIPTRVAGVPEPVEQAARQVEIPVHDDDSINAELILRGQAVLVPDIEAVSHRMHPSLLGLARQVGVTSYVAVPLVSKHRVLGFLGADRGGQQCTQEDVHLLTTVASHVAVALDNALTYQQLEQLTQTLEQRVQERTRELQEANVKLQDLDRLKSEFFANISHEFRTPLTLSLASFKELWKLAPAAKTREQINVGMRNTGRLLSLINEFLDLAKFDRGALAIKKLSIDMAALVRAVAANFEASDRRRIHLRGVNEPMPLEADPHQMKKVLYNLLANAVKFSDPDRGEVWIRLATKGDRVELEVEDNGIGIPRDQLNRIFERFAQVERRTTRRQEGTGIGLALVREIVAQHGGTVTVESELGRGSTFTVSLPRGAASLETIVTVEEDDAMLPPVVTRHLPERATPAAAAPVPVTERPLVLVADDNADMRTYVERLLLPQYRVALAKDGVEALEQAKRMRPDLILTDIMMPRLCGNALLKAVREDQGLRDIPVVFLTAKAGTEARIESLEAGANDYIPKPFDEQEILARVGNLIRLHAQERELIALQREKMTRFLPVQLADVIFSDRADEALKSHRAEITVVFIDLRGFTSFAETAEPEDVMAVLQDYQTEMGRLISEHQGVIERFSGDAIMIFFNDPVPVPNHAEQAVRLAIAMRSVVERLRHKWRQRGSELGAGIGVATGYATLGLVGFEQRKDYAAIGAVTNLAARLCGEARHGQILISERVRHFVKDLVHAESVGTLTLKGFQKPVPAYNVAGLRESRPVTRKEQAKKGKKR
jgi:signal transduction histidine kinase/class 3 adenylate cyclase